MIKAADIKKINPKEYIYLTKDLDGVYAWNHRPAKEQTMWAAKIGGENRGFWLGNIEVEEFHGKDWKDCLIEFEPDYVNMIGCVGFFWDDNPKKERIGFLIEVDKGNKDGAYYSETGYNYKHFRPAKPEELKFFEEK